jgi:lipopolysaccharide/colanic/teichoic acid biosynthesis glycosyltransferase
MASVAAAREPASRLGYPSPKRVFDVALAVVLLLLTAPLLLLAMALVKLTSRGPAIYRQVRLGRNGRPFTLFKIRTMAHECEKLSGPCWSMSGDPRVTAVGRWMRKAHVDELPQLWNVLRGEMSLVGPRPERPEFVAPLEKMLPQYRRRMLVRPGITGLAQVQLPPDTDLASVRLKLAYDLQYVEALGFWLDWRILGATLCKVLGLPFWTLRRMFGFTAPPCAGPRGFGGAPLRRKRQARSQDHAGLVKYRPVRSARRRRGAVRTAASGWR